jgi:ferric-dicitrate binding protein FerR (iron transport regulator)
VLLGDREDRTRLLELIDKLLADSRVQGTEPTPAQVSMLETIRAALPVKAGRGPQLSASVR